MKTAGTTWLEEVIGLAESGSDGLKIAQNIYAEAYGRFDELVKPYATVVDIDQAKLPTPGGGHAAGVPRSSIARRCVTIFQVAGRI